jgi:hypothetical protein
MFTFETSEQRPKEILDVFKEFEQTFNKVIYKSIVACTYFELENYEGIEERVPIIPKLDFVVTKIKSQILIEKIFEVLINAIYDHLETQLQNYSAGELGNFFYSNNLSYQVYLPERRSQELSEKIILEVYQLIGQETIDHHLIEFGKITKNLYAQNYELLYEKIQKLENIYSKFTLTKETQEETFNKSELQSLGFFELEKVKLLSDKGQDRLIELIRSNDLPYKIAMLEHLEFLDFLFNKKIRNKSKVYKLLSTWFGLDERSVKGNCLVLIKSSKEDRTKYKAHTKFKSVQNDYLNLV